MTRDTTNRVRLTPSDYVAIGGALLAIFTAITTGGIWVAGEVYSVGAYIATNNAHLVSLDAQAVNLDHKLNAVSDQIAQLDNRLAGDPGQVASASRSK